MATLLSRSSRLAARPSRNVCVAVRAQQNVERPAARAALQQIVKPAALTAVANVIMAMPALAEEGKLFDFNLTLPVMAGEFLLLMFFLDKFWFGPVGKVLDERDGMIRSKLSSVKSGAEELDSLASEAEKVVKDARNEVAKMIQTQKAAKQTELDKIYAEAKSRITKETEDALAAAERESQALLSKLDAQVEAVSAEVLKRVLPAGVKV